MKNRKAQDICKLSSKRGQGESNLSLGKKAQGESNLSLGKKAQGHVEMILSAVIFIGFILFILVFLNPFTRTKDTSFIMDNMEREILNNITASVGKLSVIVNTTSDCYDSSKINSYGTNYIEIQDSVNLRKYTIYYHDSFSGILSCTSGENYTLGTYSNEEIVVEENIINLRSEYENNYDNLKTNLGITNEFLFKTRDLLGDEISELSVDRNIPVGVNVESRDVPIRTINNNKEIKELILNIRAW